KASSLGTGVAGTSTGAGTRASSRGNPDSLRELEGLPRLLELEGLPRGHQGEQSGQPLQLAQAVGTRGAVVQVPADALALLGLESVEHVGADVDLMWAGHGAT